MGLGGENKHFLFYIPYVKNASFSRYSIVLFSHIPVQELSRLAKRVFALRARNYLLHYPSTIKILIFTLPQYPLFKVHMAREEISNMSQTKLRGAKIQDPYHVGGWRSGFPSLGNRYKFILLSIMIPRLHQKF